MRRVILSVCAVLFASVVGAAQATPTYKLQWEQPGITTVVQAQALNYRLQIDAAPAVVVPQTCALNGSVVSCTTPIPALSQGAHTLVLTVDNGFGTASASLSGSSPSAPVSVSVVVTVIVQ